METLDLVRPWQHSADEPHPAGEIRLWTAGGLARRADLLSGHEAFADTTGTTTLTPDWETIGMVTDEEIW